MKTALKSLTIGLLISSSCGFAAPTDAAPTPVPVAASGASNGLSGIDCLKIAAAVYVFELAADAAHHYILAPALKNPQNFVTKSLEEIRKLLDTKKDRTKEITTATNTAAVVKTK